MAQTKRKRQTKHRGNAAGGIEARGRTSRKAEETKGRSKTSRSTNTRNTAVRPNRPPTWKMAAMKAGFMSVLLIALALSGIFKTKMTLEQTLMLGLFAFALYTPLSFWTDTAIYKRRLRKEGSAKR